MAEESKNKQISIKHLRKGLSIYKTNRSAYWYARYYDSVRRKYVVRSTKETTRLEAAEVAEEIVASYKSKQNTSHAVTKERSFEHYAKLLSQMTKSKAKSSNRKYAFSDQSKILFREGDGLVLYFGKHDVGKITSGMVRDYLLFLDSRRKEPLANSTKAKQCGVIRQVLMLALEDGVIDIIPPMPKQRTVDKPRVSFTEAEYSRLLKVAREIADAGTTVVRGVPVTREHYNLIVFAVHSFLRPTETELFGIRFADIEVKDDPKHLLMRINGKTGLRLSASMEAAVDMFEKQKELYPDASPTDYVFMDAYKNRTTAVNTYRRIFNHFLDKAGLKVDLSGNARSPYSLRHYALQTRLRKSEGDVNIYWLAENAGTSVDQLERFYLKNMEPTTAKVKNLQSFKKS
ncbi:phage integrase SAM-like domain-containing protein [Ponticoccus sp. SC2-23]|uniref:phage integrase SAM-like domain-containing protein n=1 Tax=Alexandriicola marinus TaxID=2081710 RepID=UPI000FDCA742|nr:phage integrase SAM-like domain-containing protein [Alexandriicola marinus]MBM1222538.1 phage integrase SAM-like domain-containing protein [Ponticoccus sp. SC6-9]MBM1227043.1 phage integrase SAM-like domain-containing protein [Ponticoccus sp. SC6-15]MBM1231464.1 phage integrase SAM-like domain-containing protein [Ponticoccus sp. SC6-38]MBM1236100.1 phage integrase SAM-like domain-containing protein [Ponticoccus sp. SC6-45]MBM1240487.1 phage integrase SAM-like domain-containing protein [Pont